MNRTLRWRPASGAGEEVARVRERADGVEVESEIRGAEDGIAFRLAYRLRCDARWRTRLLELSLADGGALALRGDGEGGWRDGAGRALDTLAGCIDVDVTATPLTNTLPIRRLALPVGASAAIRVAYVEIPGLALSAREQRYARVDARRWRFEAPDIDFRRDIVVDGEGFVVDYPDLFTRADDGRDAC